MNFLRLSEECDTEENAVRFLQQRGIIHANRRCLNGHDMTLCFGTQVRTRCRIRGCRQEKGMRIGTWLEGSCLDLGKIVLFIYCWCYEMTSIRFCKRELEINHNTIVDFNNYLREVCAGHLLANPRVIGGIEILGGICRETRDCFLFAVPDRSAATVLPILTQSIAPGTTVITNKWRAYGQLQNLNFNHQTVNHSLNFVDPQTGAHTQTVERMWGVAKQRNKKQCGTHRELLDSYLCEFMWRKRIHGQDVFETILQHIADFWPPQ